MNLNELVVIGSGPAGLAATETAVNHGISVKLFDENHLPGGQFLRQNTTVPIPKSTKFQSIERYKLKYDSIIRIIKHPNVEYYPNAVVWGGFEKNRIAYTCGKKSGSLNTQFLIIATGAYEKIWPFPGWTLPGIMTAGAAINLIKGQHFFPGGRTVVCGNGPLLLAAASYLNFIEAEIIGLYHTSLYRKALQALPGLLYEPDNLIQGIKIYIALLKSRIPIHRGETIIEARGADQLEEVLIAPINQNGKPDHSKKELYKVDNLVLSFGLTPSNELSRVFGCEHSYDETLAYWRPKRSEEMETSLPGIFCVGDCAGIIGSKASILEGRLAGLAVARYLGKISKYKYIKTVNGLKAKLNRLMKFNKALEKCFESPGELLSLITENTVICRCEDIVAGELLKLIRSGASDIVRLKLESRITMGRCQGRNCLRTIAGMVAKETGLSLVDINLPRVRPPVKPILLGDLLHEDLAPPTEPVMKLP